LDQGGGGCRFPGTPQRNRNELGETSVNKTRRKHLSQQEKSATWKMFTAFGRLSSQVTDGPSRCGQLGVK